VGHTEVEQRNLAAAAQLFQSTDPSALFADDATWWNGLPLTPSNPGQTEHKGIDAIRRLITSRPEPIPGSDMKVMSTSRFEDVVYLADGDFVVRQHTECATTVSGRSYRNTCCFLFRFNDEGKIQYLTQHWNTWYAYNAMFHSFASLDVEPAHPLG
jgi:ketosteroid isomerase-like protein